MLIVLLCADTWAGTFPPRYKLTCRNDTCYHIFTTDTLKVYSDGTNIVFDAGGSGLSSYDSLLINNYIEFARTGDLHLDSVLLDSMVNLTGRYAAGGWNFGDSVAYGFTDFGSDGYYDVDTGIQSGAAGLATKGFTRDSGNGLEYTTETDSGVWSVFAPESPNTGIKLSGSVIVGDSGMTSITDLTYGHGPNVYTFSTVIPTNGYVLKFKDSTGTAGDSTYWAADETGGTLNDSVLGINEGDARYQLIGHGDADSIRNIRVSEEAPSEGQVLLFHDSTGALGDSLYWKTFDSTVFGNAVIGFEDIDTAGLALSHLGQTIASAEIVDGTIDAPDMKVASKFVAVDFYSSDSTAAESILVTDQRLIDSLTGRADDYEAADATILKEAEIDASSELVAIMDDETGAGLLVFNENCTIDSLTVTPGRLNADTATIDDKLSIAGRIETGYKAFRATITNPDGVEEDTIIIAPIYSDEFPNGITILHIKLSCRPVAPADYIVDFYETTENDWSGTETIIETASAIKVASTAREGEDDGTMSNPGIAAGAYIMAVLPATDINQLQITVIYEVD